MTGPTAQPVARPACKHCRRDKVNRPRGLCWGCYYTPGVREMYPSSSKYAHRGVGNYAGGHHLPLPAGPTAAAPGSPEKAAVLVGRAERGEHLWHPLDSDEPPDRPAACEYTPLVLDLVEDDLVSDRMIYARPVDPDSLALDGRDPLRCVLLVVPGGLHYLTPAEAEHLAGQLRGAAEERRAEAEEAGG